MDQTVLFSRFGKDCYAIYSNSKIVFKKIIISKLYWYFFRHVVLYELFYEYMIEHNYTPVVIPTIAEFNWVWFLEKYPARLRNKYNRLGDYILILYISKK
jgi:hypothetical protein